MHFKFTEDQSSFRDSFAALLKDKCTPKAVREVWEKGGRIEGLWNQMAEMGVLGIQGSIESGGLGLTEVETVLMMETAGYYCLPEPFLEHSAVAIPTLVEAQKEAEKGTGTHQLIESYLSAAVEGTKVISAVSPTGAYAAYGESADAFLIAFNLKSIYSNSDYSDSKYSNSDYSQQEKLPQEGIYLIPKEEAKIHIQKSLDAPRNPARIECQLKDEFFLGDETGSEGGGTAGTGRGGGGGGDRGRGKRTNEGGGTEGGIVSRAFERGALAAAGECIGIAQRLLDMAVEYTKERKQFGKPVGSQQAIKHHLAQTAIAIEHSRPAVYAAACILAGQKSSRTASREEIEGADRGVDVAEVSISVASAKAMASETANLAARKALQCHGAIGYTLESDLSMWLKKAWVTAASWGDSDYHWDRAGKLLLDQCLQPES